MNEIKTLDDLIEKKYKLITTIGVFSALLLLSLNLQIQFLTFGFFAIFLLLINELSRSLPHFETPLWDISSLQIIEAIFFFLILMPIYFYFANYSIVLHPENKLNFTIFFILAPYGKFFYWVFLSWLKNPEVIQLSEQQKRYQIWKNSVSCLFIVICLEMTFITMKILGG
jgi:hypothetical protein